jgi:hypothetical protein
VLHHELVKASKLLTTEERIEVLADYLDNRHEPRQLTVDETANALRRYGERVSRAIASAVARTRKQRDEDSKGVLDVVVPTTHSAPQQNWSWMNHSRTQHKQIGTRHNSVKSLCVQQIYGSALKA